MGVSATTRLPHWSGSRERSGGRADGTAAAWRTDGVLLVSPAAERGQDGISIGDRRCSCWEERNVTGSLQIAF